MQKNIIVAVLAEIAACKQALRQYAVPARHLPDLVQECRIEAWRALEAGRLVDERVSLRAGRLQDPERHQVRGWWWRVGARAAWAFHGRGGARRFGIEQPFADVGGMDSAHAHVLSAEDLAVVCEERVQLEEALRALAAAAPGVHSVLTRYELDGQEIKDIAADLSIPPNTAWNRLRHGRAALRRSLELQELRSRGRLARWRDGRAPQAGAAFGNELLTGGHPDSRRHHEEFP